VEASGGGSGITDSVQKAIDDLRKAGEKATGDVRSGIDSAVARLRDVSGDATSRLKDVSAPATSRASDQVSSWRSTLESATEDVRKELGKLAVRAQSSLESVEELGKELDERRKALGGEVKSTAKKTTKKAKKK
jgi:hypothetical protein